MDVGIVSRVVHPLHGHGGMEKHVYQLATGLAERGVNVELFCMATDEEIPTELQHENLDLTFVPYTAFPIGKLSYLSFIKNLAVYTPFLDQKDVVHFQGMLAGTGHTFLGDATRVYTPHGLEEFKHQKFKYLLAPFNLFEVVAARRADRIVSLGSGNTRDITTYLHVGTETLREIPNGVDIEFFQPVGTAALEEQYDLNENVVVAVSRLVEYKGHHLLVDAVNRMDDTSLVIAGDGPFREELERRAGDDVHFAGRVEEAMLPAYYSLGDVFCLPTFGEGMPLSVLEALACGTPVLATRVGSIPDIVDDEVGTLVRPRSADALQAGLDRLFAGDIGAMSDRCRERAVDRHSWDRTVDETLDLYKTLTA